MTSVHNNLTPVFWLDVDSIVDGHSITWSYRLLCFNCVRVDDIALKSFQPITIPYWVEEIVGYGLALVYVRSLVRISGAQVILS
jgi:hypothetical protein